MTSKRKFTTLPWLHFPPRYTVWQFNLCPYHGYALQGLQLIIGAHVGETSVLSRAGLTLAAAAGDARVAMEGAFGTHLLEHDVCEPPLMFGKGGELYPEEWHFSAAAGNGLEIKGQRAL